MSNLFKWFFLAVCTGFSPFAIASHIVGGDLTYRCLGPGPNNTVRYELRLEIFQDCINGAPPAIAEDNPAYIRIFEGNGASYLFDSIAASSILIVPPNFFNECVNDPPTVCLRKATFIRTYNLPINNSGYIISYQRCCRNATILNIAQPGTTGTTYFCVIPPPSVTNNTCNNGAVFKNFPPQIICINNPLIYDHSATDADGDSLSYELCEAYQGGGPNDAKPIPSPPPYQPVVYINGYTALKPLGGFPTVKINPQTGIVSGTPNALGRYVVTVCCHEWRNGVVINTVKREFQFEVTPCSKAVVANIPQYSEEFNTYIVECRSNKVSFVNLSTGGSRYYWDFGVNGTSVDTSNEFEPTFSYPDTGSYEVKLVVNRNSTCPDSITRIVKVYPTYEAAFITDGLPCPNAPIQFLDSSVATYPPVVSWLWSFGDGDTSTQQNPAHVYNEGGEYNVSLISKSRLGCVDTFWRTFSVEPFQPFAGNDTFIVKGETILFNATGGGTYLWTPPTYLSNPNIGNPIGYYPNADSVTYSVFIRSPKGCEGYDTFTVRVLNQGILFVPTAFSPNGDGRNDVLRPLTVGFRDLKIFRIFNRFGEEMYFTTKFDEGWDGYHKGKPAEQGVYYWFLQIVNRFGKEEMIKGDTMLLR